GTGASYQRRAVGSTDRLPLILDRASHRDPSVVGAFEADLPHGDEDGKDRRSRLRIEGLHAANGVAERAAAAGGYRAIVLMKQLRRAARRRRHTDQPESLDLAEVVAALRLGDGDFCQAKFERRIVTREDRTRIDGHAPWIGGKLRDGIAACSKARIGRKHVVQYHRLALLPRLVPRLRDSRGFVLDTNALGRSGDELVLRGVYVEAVGVGKAGAVLDAVFLEGKDRSVR